MKTKHLTAESQRLDELLPAGAGVNDTDGEFFGAQVAGGGAAKPRQMPDGQSHPGWE